MDKKDAVRRYREKHIAMGLCKECKRTAVFGIQRCEYHREHHREYSKKWRENRIAIGVCKSCNRPAVAGYLLCTYHRAYHQKWDAIHGPLWRKKCRDTGRCIRCGIALDSDSDGGRVQCLNCNERGRRNETN